MNTHACTWCLWGAEEGIGSLELELTDGLNYLVGAELKPGPPQEQPALLAAGPHLQTP